MAQLYEVSFYDGYQDPPVYHLFDGITGETPEQALADNLEAVTEKVREVLHLDSDCTDHFIHHSLFALRPVHSVRQVSPSLFDRHLPVI